MFISTAVYVGSSIYSPAISDAASYFGVSNLVSTLGLSIFVVGYGVGPLFLSPITELPQIGRTIPYIIPLAIFCILQVPTALVTNFAGFLVLRFIAGFVSSPPLATGGEWGRNLALSPCDICSLPSSLHEWRSQCYISPYDGR